jgi:hypothetical protein
MKKINKQIKYTRKKINKKNLRKKNSKKKNMKGVMKGVMKGGYDPGVVPQVVFSTNVEDPHFDNPFYQYQYYNTTCPYYPTVHEAKSCYSKHKGTPDDHADADACIQNLQNTKYKETPGKCNHNTCCDATCWGVCPAYHTIFINGVYIPVIWAWHEGKWIAKEIDKLSKKAALAETEAEVGAVATAIEADKGQLKEVGQDIGDIAPAVKVDNDSSGDGGDDKAEAKDDDKKGDDKGDGKGDDKGEDKGEAKEGEKGEAKEGEKGEEKKGGTRKRRFFDFSKKVSFSRKYRKRK